MSVTTVDEQANASRQRPFAGQEYGRVPDGTYLKNWNPIMLASELVQGKIVGKDFLGTRIIVYRNEQGEPVVQSAYCPHVGADLSGGEIVDGKVRCPYHHWKFAADGRCAEIPGETIIPGAARIYNYPAAERWGMIWAFNGEEPLYPLPEMPNLREDELVYRAFHRGQREIEGWIGSSNLVDFQHLSTVHGIPDPNPVSVVFEDYLITVRQESVTRIADTQLWGATWLTAHMQFPNGSERLFMAGSSQVAPGWSDAFFVVAMRRSDAEKMGDQAAQEELDNRIAYMHKLYAEDEPILFKLRFRGYGKSALLRADKYFGQFLQYLEKYPRSAPFDV
ncbi:nitrite reductase/ring-hydroxylating ferredoxin subunit [Sphingobium sp. B7D2B]|uniref:Rieske 2Fe-2S domain-containing protein n=1 Tax=Sphingobium sp. B7D2B TaxID=2940583 RepID=UPI002224EAC5|nr:Rieske 2Fe-2S domain-containing protein [Sphingobium sp. B7D2B]MCW2365368.1 nitrite reductase/ring-hydroxylating ferredoxin subunit [Sphingobium sp. B7D2B]